MLTQVLRRVFPKLRYVPYFFWEKFSKNDALPAKDINIDVIIPVIETDLVVLPLCIEGIKKNINHPVQNIYIVSPDNAIIQKFATDNGLVFISETTLFDFTPADINYFVTAGRHKNLNRSGWIYQQLIKLSGKAGTCRYYLVVDADHILLKPHTFIAKDGRFVFYQSPEYNPPYYRAIKRLLGFYPTSLFSYVSHKMIFDKEELAAMKQQIEQHAAGNRKWYQAIIDNLNSNEVSDFSEFELYGNFLQPRKKILRPWKEKMIEDTNGEVAYTELQQRYPGKLSVTIPYYFRNKKAAE